MVSYWHTIKPSVSMEGSTGERLSPAAIDRRRFLSLTAGTAATAFVPPVWSKPKVTSIEDLTGLTLHEVSRLLRSKEVSPVELTRACLGRIEQYDNKVNAFITVTQELALAQAQAAEKEILAGRWRGPLHGVPVALKDNIDTAGIRTSGGSAVYVTRVPSKDAEVVQRLKQAGSVLLGKLNMDEFGAGAEGIISYWGAAHNPWSLDHITGGSSSGAGAAVAADFCFGALGTDTGGSVRIPSSLCGIVGLKPTYGLISIGGVIPACESLDHVGPMCKSVLDAALLLQVLAGYDADWSGSVKADLPDYATATQREPARPRLGIPRAYFFDNLEPDVAEVFGAALTLLRSMAAGVTDNVLVPDGISLFNMLVAELAAYHKELVAQKPNLYQPSVLKWISKGPTISSADYILARKHLDVVRRDAPTLFEDFDLLVMPTWKKAAMTIADRVKQIASEEDQPVELYNTLPFNVLGLPAISVPCGFTKAGLPVGLQIVGPPFAESKVLALAHAYEQGTQWHLRKPKLA